MKPILKKQTIRIDCHQQGTPINWYDTSQDIHLHKSQNNDKRQNSYDIRIPLNSDRKVTYNDKNFPIPKKIQKEIKRAFEDSARRKRFVDDLKDTLKNFNWTENDSIDVAKRIAIAFGLNEDALINSDSKYSLRLISEDSCKYQVFVNIKKKFLVVGEFQPFSANGLSEKSKKQWNEYLFNHISAIFSAESCADLKMLLKNAQIEIPGIGIKTVDDTLARIQLLYDIFN